MKSVQNRKKALLKLFRRKVVTRPPIIQGYPLQTVSFRGLPFILSTGTAELYGK
jgi:hypothetical protein